MNYFTIFLTLIRKMHLIRLNIQTFDMCSNQLKIPPKIPTSIAERSTEDSTETISQTDSTERIPRTLGEFDNVSAPKKPASPEHPFIQYFERLRLIYELGTYSSHVLTKPEFFYL